MESRNNQIGFRITDTLKLAIEAASSETFTTKSGWIEQVITEKLIEAGYIEIIPKHFGFAEMILTKKCQPPVKKRGRPKKVTETDKKFIEAQWKARQWDALIGSLRGAGLKIQLPEHVANSLGE